MSDSLPLSGLRVLDLTQVQLGPCATQVLGDFGAEIVKVERPQGGDLSRALDPFVTEKDGQSAYYMALNRNKRSLALDMASQEGRAIVQKLALQADVLVHNFRPGVASRLGLGFESLREKNPRLIYASGSGFGEEGPLTRKAGQDFLAQSMSGLASRNTSAEGAPQIFPTALGDFSAGMILVQGILLALLHRQKTGKGQSISVSLLDTLLTMQQQEATQWMLRKKSVNWVTQNLIGTFRTSDGVVSLVGVFRKDPLKTVCQALDIPDLTEVPDFGTLAEQMEKREQVWDHLRPAFAKFTTAECLRRLDGVDILCAEVLTLDEALTQEQIATNKLLVEFNDPVHGQVCTTGNPLKLSSVVAINVRTPPRLGEHSGEILRELGYRESDISHLLSSKVISQAG